MKGLNACFSKFASPQGTIGRGRNLLLTKRGALVTCDGSQIFSRLEGVVHPLSDNIGPITELFLYQPIGADSSYYAIAKDLNTHIGFVLGFTAVDGGGSGALSAGQYLWAVTALDGAGGETLPISSSLVTLAASHKGQLDWTAKVGAVSYNIYRTKANGSTLFFVANITAITYLDNIADAALVAGSPPLADSTQVCQFYKVPVGTYGAATIIKTLNADVLPGKDGTGGGGGGTGGSSGNKPPTPQGGVVGNLSPSPLILQFADKMFLALGNGVPPMISDGTTPNTVNVTNTFTALYPDWAASTGYAVGDIIKNSGYVFQAVQGGVSGTVTPLFETVKGTTATDKQIIWKNIGVVSGSPAPPGAAHAEIYAGSVWVANTAPIMSTDELDGPSALRMSDSNNPNSWNPLNSAQISRDDGDQITGIKAYTVAEAGIAPSNFLVIFKNFATYLISGVFGSSNFAITRLQTDMGCLASRSIQFIPGFGIMRLSHLGFCVTDGLRDRLLSEEIRPYLFGGESDIVPMDWSYAWFSKGAQTADPPMYVCAVPIGSQAASSGATWVAGAVTALDAPFMAIGTYYLVLKGIIDANNSYVLTQEIGPLTIVASQRILVEFPVDPNVTKWQVFIGNAAGEENVYTEFDGTATSGLLTSLNAVPQFFSTAIQSIVRTSGVATAILADVSGLLVGSKAFISPQVTTSHPTFDNTLAGNVTIATVDTGTNTITYLQTGADSSYSSLAPGAQTVNLFQQRETALVHIGTPVGSAGALTRIFCYDLVLKAWMVIDLPFSISVLKQFRAVGSIPITAMTGFYDGAIRRWQMGDTDWDEGALNAGAADQKVEWMMQDQELFGEDGAQKVYYRRMVLRFRGDAVAPTVTPVFSGELGQALKAALIAVGDESFEGRVDIQRASPDFHAIISGKGTVEMQSIDYQFEPKPVGAALVIS